MNRLSESLFLYKEMCKTKYLDDCNIVLVLNMHSLFEIKADSGVRIPPGVFDLDGGEKEEGEAKEKGETSGKKGKEREGSGDEEGVSEGKQDKATLPHQLEGSTALLEYIIQQYSDATPVERMMNNRSMICVANCIEEGDARYALDECCLCL